MRHQHAAARVRPVEFASEGATLRGHLYLPDAGAPPPHPLVVMAPGSSATIRMAFDRHAEALAARGLAVLLYDQRNTGESGASRAASSTSGSRRAATATRCTSRSRRCPRRTAAGSPCGA